MLFGVLSSIDQLSTECYCPEYWKGFTSRWHIKSNKVIQINNWKTAEWVKKSLLKRSAIMISGRSFQYSSHACSPGRARIVVDEGLNDVQEISMHMKESGNICQLFKTNNLMDRYVKGGSMMDAYCLFENMPVRDVVSWNVIILGHAKQEEGAMALNLYARMLREGVQPSARTFLGALKACSGLAAVEDGKLFDGKYLKLWCLEKGRAIHSQVVRSGFESDIFLGNSLVDMYGKCGSMDDGLHVFDEMPYHDVVSWTAVILGHAMQEEGLRALELYAEMHREGIQSNTRTFVCALKACSSVAALEHGNQDDGKLMQTMSLENGRSIHSQVVRSGSESNSFVATALVDMYAKCGSMEDAYHTFNELPQLDVVSWTAMILGYAKQEEGMLALELYSQMHKEGVQPNARTLMSVVKACTSLIELDKGNHSDGKSMKLGCLEKGRTIHCHIMRSAFESDLFVGTTLVDMYAKCGSMEDARHVFDALPRRGVVSWNAMIFGYMENEESEEALRLYAQLQEQGLSADSLTFISVLKACGNIAALEIGKALHSEIRKGGCETSVAVANTLIDMYAKCGSMVDAHQLFDALPRKDVVTWTALLAGYAHQGESDMVFHMLERMCQEGVQPDGLTFISVLTACSHVGLVEKGQEYFQAMTRQFGIIPTIEHYNCMIDLFGRAGHVEDAVMMVGKMPFEPDVVVWLTVLGACQKWKNVDVGRRAFQHAVSLDARLAAAYVLMSNIYADAHMWEDQCSIEAMRKKAQAWTKPDQSWWTDIGGMVHKFQVGDLRHPQNLEVYAKLKDLSVKMKVEGYVPGLDCVLEGTCEGENEDALCGHSEKLALACALINTPEGTPIRINKSLKYCEDCHKATAIISKMEHRKIICRDAIRFHNYKDGICSCGDFW